MLRPLFTIDALFTALLGWTWVLTTLYATCWARPYTPRHLRAPNSGRSTR